MNQLPGKCPVCDNALNVTRLQCGNCGTGIDGLFGLGKLQALSREQIQFIETFIKCRGKIKDVEAELGISYPTVVTRLNDVVRAMGYDVDESDLSEVDRYEFYEAQVLKPQTVAPHQPRPPAPPMPPMPPMPPIAPVMTGVPGVHGPRGGHGGHGGSRLTPEQKQQIMDDLAAGKLTAAEAMERLNG